MFIFVHECIEKTVFYKINLANEKNPSQTHNILLTTDCMRLTLEHIIHKKYYGVEGKAGTRILKVHLLNAGGP